MLRKTIVAVLGAALLGLVLPTHANATVTTAVVKDHQIIGNNSLFGAAPAGVINVKYRAVYQRTHTALGEPGILPLHIRFRQKKADSWFNGRWPFGIERVYYKIKIVDDMSPTMMGTIYHTKVWMYPSYYSKTFNIESAMRKQINHPRICVRVHFKIFLNPDHEENMHCRDLT